MSLIADGLLIATGLTAGVYCFVLSRRLKAFASTESGVGQQIHQLNISLEETRSALKDAQAGAEKQAAALARDIVLARKLSTQLTNLIASAEELGREAVSSVSAQHSETDSSSQPHKSTAAQPIGIPADDLEPKQEPSVQAESDIEEFDPGEVSFEQALNESDGEVQLGFLPDEDLGLDADESSFEEADPLDSPEDTDEVELDEEPLSAAAQASDGQMLKVERVAL